MTQRQFTLGIGATFLLPWLILIVFPHGRMSNLRPIPYTLTEIDENLNDVGAENTHYPPGRSGLMTQGAAVYAKEGCAYCHTQMVRPTYLGLDRWRNGWSGRGLMWQGDQPGADIRETRPRDYLGEKFAYLGVNRLASDLSNVGWRILNEADYHKLLFNPRSVHFWSKMPSYRHLYTSRELDGPPPSGVIVIREENRLIQIVPGKEAEALVSYLMSLKKDYKLPGTGNDDKKREAMATQES